MTTGNQVISGSTSSFSGFPLYFNQVRRVWSGSDYPKTASVITKVRDYIPVERIRVYKGQTQTYVKYVQRWRIPQLPPRRKFTIDHNYTVSYDLRHNPVMYYSFNGGASWFPNNGGGVGCGPDDVIINYAWDANDTIGVIGKLREAVAGSDFNAAVFCAELPEALGMIANSAYRIDRAWRAAKRGNFKKARSYLVGGTPRAKIGKRTAASNWLELQYGWLPLLKDAENAAQFIAWNYSAPPLKVYRVRSSKKPGSVRSTSPSNCLGWRYSSVYSSVQIKAMLTEKDVVALSGLMDPLSVAWEKLPYSFVIDWFIPIGNYLSARGLSQSLTGTFVTTRRDVCSVKGPINNPASGFLWNGAEREYKREQKLIARSVSTTLSVPLPNVKPLSQTLSWRHCANAVALLLQGK